MNHTAENVAEKLEGSALHEQATADIGGRKKSKSIPTQQNQLNKQNGLPEIIPLDHSEHPKPLDKRCMPPAVVNIVWGISDPLQTPPEIAWGAIIATIATAIGARARIKLPTHSEPSPLWTCSIAAPGGRKSAVFAFVGKPLADLESELAEGWLSDHRRWEAKKLVSDKVIHGLMKDAQKPGILSAKRTSIENDIEDEREALGSEPIKPVLSLTDSTTEALRRVLQQQGSIGFFSSEGSSVFDSFGRYSGNRGADMALYLAAYSGDADKGARVSGTHGVRTALASMALTAQPDVLQSIGNDQMATGRGFVDRFLFLVPADVRGKRNYYDYSEIQAETEMAWDRMVRDIMRKDVPDAPATVELTQEAKELWLEFAQEIEDKQGEGLDLHSMAGFASKLAGAVGRIALAYHFAQGLDEQTHIGKNTMIHAVGMGYVLLDHAKRARKMMGEDAATVRARNILAWIKRNGLEEIKPRDVVAAGAGGCRKVEEAKEACSTLEKHGYLISVETKREGTSGRLPRECWAVHPHAFADHK